MQEHYEDLISGSLEDRAVGALVGLAVGDALGTSVEFMSRGQFVPVTDMRGGGVYQLAPGEWTDDTSMALALGEAMLQDPSLSDPSFAMNRWVNWYHYGMYSHNGRCFDIGRQTAEALTKWAESTKLASEDSDAAGNGCIMRLAPIVLANLSKPGQLRDVARRQSDLTHRNAKCRDVSERLANLIAACIFGENSNINKHIPPEISARVERDVKSTGYVEDTFEAALWAFAPQDGFENIVLRAVNLGDDADTVGAVAGQIAGARFGLSGIPEAWVAGLAWQSDIIEMGRRLYQISFS